MEQHPCHLERAAGRTATCPGATCGLWADGACSVAPLRAELDGNPGLVELLTGLRRTLETHDPRSARRAFHPPGLA